MQEKNFIIFLILSVIIIFIWSTFFMPKPKVVPKPGDTQAGSTMSQVTPPPSGGTAPAAGSTAPPPSSLPGGTASAPAMAETPQGPTVKVVTDVAEVELTPFGAAPLSWKLTQFPKQKCYKYRINIEWPPLKVNPPCDTSPVDLVEDGSHYPNLPFMAEVSVDGDKVPMSATWEAEAPEGLDLRDGATAGQVVFRTAMEDGRVLKKIYRFKKDRYDVGLTFRVEGGETPQRAQADVAMFYKWSPDSKSRVPRWNYNGPEAHNGNALMQMKPDKVIKVPFETRESVIWAGFSYDYFLTAVVAGDTSRFVFTTKYIGTEAQKKDKKAEKDFVGWARIAATSHELESGEVARAVLFMGPKQKDILTGVSPSLRYSIDYGMLKILVLPLLEALDWINAAVHNFGVSIIILTVVLRMAMFPLTRKSQKSMKDMQKLQPEIKALKEKYPDDKVKQNEEMQALWRKHKINPAMGCLPMLLQMPVFFAFYKALLISIELRQAPFFGWIVDLSERDPLYIWPVLMGATQFITQKMTPTQMDPMQQKVFLVMPIIFMYILRDFPSGLLIYWTVQNIVGIGQQLYVNQQKDLTDVKGK
ncbi:MAG TPA: membrane protein insertase YidC [bacterium]|nr:membrane protein insertase YidC [bacterium]